MAIVGIGCRFPGRANSPEEFWGLLRRGEDAVSELPASRFDARALCERGLLRCPFGGVLTDIDRLDATFFGLSPREAASLDPQHRLLLELTWEALEDAGMPVDRLSNESVGVYLGLTSNEYLDLQRQSATDVDLVTTVGGQRHAAAGRIAHAFKLRGPCLVIDTDRSSSLVALDAARRALQAGDCNVAIVGGANLVLTPDVSIAFSGAGLLAPDGKCKFGDASADGFVRSDGAAVVVLKTLDAALADRDPIYAVVAGSAVLNAAGSGGDLTAPSQEGQQQLLDMAYRSCGVDISRITYIEAHGTGTPVGDAVELNALGAFLREAGYGDTCPVGSVKTNIGHTEAAAGIAGLVKVALSLKHGIIPASLHFQTVNPSVDLGLPVRVQTRELNVCRSVSGAVMGVSAFGLTGTLAHAVLEEPPTTHRGAEPAVASSSPSSSTPLVVLPLSARTDDALRSLGERYVSLLSGPSAPDLVDLAHTASRRRSHLLPSRLAVVGRSRQEVAAKLSASLLEEPATHPPFELDPGRRRLVMVFPGQGSQWLGMGRTLLDWSPVFRTTLERFDSAIREIAHWSLLDELRASPSSSRLDEIEIVQPAITAIAVALAHLWRSLGVVPDAVVGTSVGEVAAACVAGAITVEDAVTIVCSRTRLMARLRGSGAMGLVGLPAEDVRRLLLGFPGLEISGENSPKATIVGGIPDQLDTLIENIERTGAFAAKINVDVASHTAQMEVIAPDLREELRTVRPADGKLPIYSTTRGCRVAGRDLDAAYWIENLRRPVLLSQAITQIIDDDFSYFLEVSPHPVLWSSVAECVAHAGARATVHASLRRDEDEPQGILQSVAALYVAGYPIDWSLIPQPTGRHVALPPYPWQRQRFWFVPARDVRLEGAAAQQSSAPARAFAILDSTSAAPSSSATRRGSLTAGEVETLLVRHLRELLRLPSDAAVDPRQPFREVGLKSLFATELAQKLSALLGRIVPTSAFFDYPNVEALSQHLAGSRAEPRREDPAPRRMEGQRHARATEPIAIVGIGCRFPGADGPAAFWELLRRGGDAITEIPGDRWNVDDYYDPDPSAVGKMHTRWGGFLSSVADFDAEFFGISPKEAEVMDPQQRLLLETTWHALEHASISPQSLRGSNAGVFIGMMNTNEYASLKRAVGDARSITAHDSTGDAVSIAVGRLSYFYGCNGPSIAVDTACSSSLTAIHLACQTLRLRECDLAMAGGINVIVWPATTIAFSKTRMLSHHGRCRTFDAAADGYVRGEGGGILILKRLSTAIEDGDRILAVIRGSAVNQDGRTSGMTAPNGLAQRQVIREALSHAEIKPSELTYVEAHGTGTPLGDPIEAHALGDVFGPARAGHPPLRVGSVKTNIGHLEAAAGVAGVIKVVLSMQHKEIPAHLHLTRLNPEISPDELGFEVPTTTVPWDVPPEQTRIAGVSSFGFSGTNAHVVLQEWPPDGSDVHAARASHHVVAISARSPEALRELAQRHAGQLRAEPDVSLDAVASTLNVGRAHFGHRAAFTTRSIEELVESLESLRGDGDVLRGYRGERRGAASPRIAFIYTGQSAQFPRMGLHLYQTRASFRAAIDRCNEAAAPYVDRPLLDVLFGDQSELLLSRVEYAQPAIFALEVALTEFWKACGIRPSYVLGHGLGEYAAAVAAGVVGLADAMRSVARRAALVSRLDDPGVAAAVDASADVAAEHIAQAGCAKEAAVAAINGPDKVLVAGTRRAIATLLDRFRSVGIPAEELTGLSGEHSPVMDPLLDAFEEVGRSMAYGEPVIPVVSGLEGRKVEGAELCTPLYWRRLVREPVRFSEAIATLDREGCSVFVEIGPRHTLLRLGQACLPGHAGLWVPSLRHDRPDGDHVLDVIAAMYARGCDIDWTALSPKRSAPRLSMPTYPFRRSRFWVRPLQEVDNASTLKADVPASSLLGSRVRSVFQRIVFEAPVTREDPAIRDHALLGIPVMPAAAQLCRILAAAESLGASHATIQGVLFPNPLAFPDPQSQGVSRLALAPYEAGQYHFEIASNVHQSDDAWRPTVAGTLALVASPREPADAWMEELPRATPVDGAVFLAAQAAWGYELGPTFQCLQQVWLDGASARCRLRGPGKDSAPGPFGLAPGLLDAVFQVATRLEHPNDSKAIATLLVPSSLDRLAVLGSVGDPANCMAHVRLVRADAQELVVDAAILDGHTPLVEITGLHLRRIGTSALRQALGAPLEDGFFEVRWERPTHRAQPGSGLSGGGTWLIFDDEQGIGTALSERLTRGGDVTLAVRPGDAYCSDESGYTIVPEEPAHYAEVVADVVRRGHRLSGVLHLWSLRAQGDLDRPAPASSVATEQVLVCGSVLHLVKALASSEPGGRPRVWGFTSGAHGTDPTHPIATSQATLWGFGRVVATEQPMHWGGLVDLDPDHRVENAIDALEQVLAGTLESEVAFRDGTIVVPRFMPLERPSAIQALFDGAGTYLVTGAFGALGQKVSRWLARRGARHLLLIGRSTPSQEALLLIEELRRDGIHAHVERADVADRESLASAVAAARRAGMPSIRGAFHAAGSVEDASLLNKDWPSFARVLSPKLLGAMNLYHVLRDEPLTTFLLFSSVCSLLGNPGQGDYCASNAFLGSFTRECRRRGLPATCIHWGPWDGPGMARTAGTELHRRWGLLPLGEYQALDAMARCLAADLVEVAISPFDERLRQSQAAHMPLFSGYLGGASSTSASTSESSIPIQNPSHAELPPCDGEALERAIQDAVASVLGLDPDTPLDPLISFDELGVDSLLSLDLLRALKDVIGRELPATTLRDHNTIEALRHFLSAEPMTASGK